MTTLLEKYISIRMRVVIDAPKLVVLVWILLSQKYQDKAVQDITLAGIFIQCLGVNG